MFGYLLTFLAGLILGAGMITLWFIVRFLAELRDVRESKAAEVFTHVPGERDLAAKAAIDACKGRLRWHGNLNPEWLPPLVEEIPKLVREIALIYHPNSVEPLLGPGLSHFTKAIQLAATDVTEFLQSRTVGKLVDVSAHTALKTWEKSRSVMQHQTVQNLNKWYKRILPYWQVVSFKSPLTWASMAVNNVAARTLQPVIVDIVAKRAVELYSGRISTSVKLLPPLKSKGPDVPL